MIGIVFIGNVEYCPYLDKYKKVLEQNNVQYEVIFWNREISDKEYPYNYIHFNKKMNNRKKKINKILYFLQYRKWLKKYIKTKKYDKLIILDTLSGILLTKVLLNEYIGKYIFDIRDYSYEKFKLFYKREEKVIKNSYFTCISSEGFKEFLPQNYEYIMAHNFNYNDLSTDKLEFHQKKQYGDVINFVWIGSVRYYAHQAKIINKLGNDNRFNIIIHGTGPDLDRLKKYSMENNIQNIKFTGKYNNGQKAELLSNADIINNSYDINIGNEVKYAISNKFYDGLIFGIPQLVEYDTFKYRKINEIEIGIGLKIDREDFADKLYEYYFEIDENKFNESCDKELKKILKEDEVYLRRIREFIYK